MQHLILIAGSLQSGKTSTATSIMGYNLTSNGVIPNFSMRNDGTAFITYDTSENIGFEFNIDSNDSQTLDWYKKVIWPDIKNCSFAEEFKKSLVNLFGLKYESVHGTNEQKNQKTHIKVKNVIKFAEGLMLDDFAKRIVDYPEDCVTGREMMQLYGTQICRAINPHCHVEAVINNLKKYNPRIGIIPDCRFDNEIEYFVNKEFMNNPNVCDFLKDVNIIPIKLTKVREGRETLHEAEMACPNIPEEAYKLVVHNQNMGLHEKNKIVIDFLCNQRVLLKSKIKEV